MPNPRKVLKNFPTLPVIFSDKMSMISQLESMLICGRNSVLHFPQIKICFCELKDRNRDFFYLFIITLFKVGVVGVQTYLIASKNQLTSITKYSYNVKKEVADKGTQKVTNSESISKMLPILGILTDHIATETETKFFWQLIDIYFTYPVKSFSVMGLLLQ